MNLLTTIVSGLFIATLTSLFTVRLALWRFHSEKWWERKAELYSRLIEALYDMHEYNRQWLEDYESGGHDEGSAEEQKRKERSASLWMRHQAAQEEIRKIAVIGAFVVSDAVADDLMNWRERHAAALRSLPESDVYDVAQTCLKDVEESLSQVREHAKEDLGIKRKLPQLFEHVAPVVVSATRSVTLGR